MSRIAHAVIGANWGDEGKGLAVDALAARPAPRDVTVVRSNGGAQAGHGVRHAGGQHHVFHHIGAGTFAGAATHLSRFFVAHPMVFLPELTALDALGARPRRITLDPRAPVTTPWDMALNQALELRRDGARHGSTGLGFGETIERQETGVPLRAGDLWHPGLAGRLDRIATDWVPRRMDALDLAPDAPPMDEVLADPGALIARFLDDCAAFRSHVALADDAGLCGAGAVLFEGAQGLQLDQDFGAFPHVTRSHTGLRNMLAIAAEAGIEAIRPTYMTRAYATRHGAGPLPHEALDGIGFARIEDRTNAPNPWQGSLREAPLDVDLMQATVARDLALAAGTAIGVDPAVGVTCLDQTTGNAALVIGGESRRMVPARIAAAISERLDLPLRLTSHGPDRGSVRFCGDPPDGSG